MSKIWFTSDTHFGHENIIKYCDRPFNTLQKMDEILIKSWNERVKPEDTVIHLGDFSLSKDFKKYKSRLNGEVLLIQGNHDKTSQSIIQNMEIYYGGRYLFCVHNPDHYEPIFDTVLCGHVHEKWKLQTRGNTVLVNVGVDVWGYKPITVNEILKEVGEMR